MGVVEFTEEEIESFDLASVLRAKPIGGAPIDLRLAMVLQRQVAERHGITIDALRSRSNKRRYSAARRDLYRLLKRAGWSYPQIGTFIGRDHASVFYSLNTRGKK